ncbi:MAG TPA: histidine phosphatase family protein [Mucilaginibacter sp.]|jgi:phosphohistidine phosphatase|nr:histidine phosphatase family protein [Mucilaginibacter sp.]
MKKLLLIRHAKAEKDTGGKDIDRPLKYPGIQDARFMADRIKEEGIIPQLIVTSPAMRTKTTAEIFADAFRLPDPTNEKSIYEASQQTWLKVINRLPDQYNFVAIVGHNPGVADILYYLTGESREVHTSTTALIEFDIDSWATISGDTGKLSYYSSPKDL